MSEQTWWNGEPCEARVVRVIVADAEFPNYWARELVGQEREAVEVRYGGEVFFLDNEAWPARDVDVSGQTIHFAAREAGDGWRKVTVGRGSPGLGHANLAVEVILP